MTRALEFASKPASLQASEILETFRQFLLAYAKRQWRDEDRRKVGDSDLVQMTMIKANQQFGDFRGKSTAELAGWLKQILKHLIISERRRLKSRKANAGPEAPIDALQVADKAPSARREALSSELKQQVLAAVAALPQHYREVVELRNFKQLSFDEIGKRLDKSHDAVRKTWARAIIRLQRELKTELDSGIVSAGS